MERSDNPAIVSLKPNKENAMTDLQISDVMTDSALDDIKVISVDVISDALSIIDAALSQMVKRELVSTSEVSDLLLDVRNLLTAAVRS